MSESLDPRERIRAAIADFRKGVESDGQVEILARCAEALLKEHVPDPDDGSTCWHDAFVWPCLVLQQIVEPKEKP